MAFQRNTAKKCTIQDLHNGTFIKKEGFESSYISTQYGNIARANILGVVVSSEQNNLTIDDGTGKIVARSFEPLSKTPELGEVVQLIGKPRVYNNEKFLVPEIIKPVQNHKWIDYRKKELGQRKKIQEAEQPEQNLEKEIKKEFGVQENEEQEEKLGDSAEKNISTKSRSDTEKIIDFIKQKDEGKGVSIAQLETLKIKDFEKKLKSLMANGEIYEVRAGFVKVLD